MTLNGWSRAGFTSRRTRIESLCPLLTWTSSIRTNTWAAQTVWWSPLWLTGKKDDLIFFFLHHVRIFACMRLIKLNWRTAPSPAGVTSRWPRLWIWAWEEPLLVQQVLAKLRPRKTWVAAWGSTSWCSTVRTRWTSGALAGFTKVWNNLSNSVAYDVTSHCAYFQVLRSPARGAALMSSTG